MKALLYLGLDPARYATRKNIIHYPIIEIYPHPFEECCESFFYLKEATHIILTSRTAVRLFFKYAFLAGYDSKFLKEKQYLAVGKATAELIVEMIKKQPLVATIECQEGLIDLLLNQHVESNAYFYPHSVEARPLIREYLTKNGWSYQNCLLYKPIIALKRELPWQEFDEIVFTSPSTVDAFFTHYRISASLYKLTSIGAITEKHLHTTMTQRRLAF